MSVRSLRGTLRAALGAALVLAIAPAVDLAFAADPAAGSSSNLLPGVNATFDGGTGDWTATAGASLTDVPAPTHTGTGALALNVLDGSSTVAATYGLAPAVGIAASPGERFAGSAY